MASVAKNLEDREADSDFAKLLNENFGDNKSIEKNVVNGQVIAIDDGFATIDVGLKSEGRVPLREFSTPGQPAEVAVGDTVEVFVERIEGRGGLTILSREKARREEVWASLEKSMEKNDRVTGVIFNRVKGGFTVDLGGAVAFLPGSQVDIRPIKDISPLMDTPQPFQILKMDRARGNIVVSRRAILEESRAEVRSELLENISEGSVVEGVVKNITDYGAFVDLGGVDGLLHVTDISWKRINHPEDVLSVGQNIEVQVIRFNEDTGRISLGMKQLEHDPWDEFEKTYQVGNQFKGRVTNVTDYGAFIELEAGIEGLVHVTEMSWTKKNVHPNKIVSTSEEVDVQVLEIDSEKRRISLGMKQTQPNPWEEISQKFKVGDVIEGPVNNITEFGMFVGLGDDIDGMVHLSDVSWEDQSEDVLKAYSQGDKVKVKVLDIDPEKERVALGIKQLTDDPLKGAMSGIAKGAVVTGTVTDIKATFVEVEINENVTGRIKKTELSRERSEQRTDRFAVGEKVDAKIISVDSKKRTVDLSIKAREIDEDKKALEEFGSTESGASLGDILGAALKEKGDDKAEDKPKAKKAAPKKKDTKKDDK
tara:strand:+ start:88972 stop:90750 length:1779 start_codon:yes stop_codon:yes gene_type:complete